MPGHSSDRGSDSNTGSEAAGNLARRANGSYKPFARRALDGVGRAAPKIEGRHRATSRRKTYLCLRRFSMMQDRPFLQLTDAVIFQKNTRQEILRDVNLCAYPGELIYVVGRVGSGKSSLLKTLYGELPLRVGRGQIAGFLLHTLMRKQIPYLRRQLGIVFQEAALLEDCTVYQNLEFVLRATAWRDAAAIDHRIWHVLHLTAMEEKAHLYPHQLSGGEIQRAGIARALLNNPQIVLADEPTANLDPDATREVMELFRSVADEGRTVIVSTHNMENLRQYPGRTWLLEDGYVTELDPE